MKYIDLEDEIDVILKPSPDLIKLIGVDLASNIYNLVDIEVDARVSQDRILDNIGETDMLEYVRNDGYYVSESSESEDFLSPQNLHEAQIIKEIIELWKADAFTVDKLKLLWR